MSFLHGGDEKTLMFQIIGLTVKIHKGYHIEIYLFTNSDVIDRGIG